MSWKEKVFSNFKLYAVTDIQLESPDLLDKIRQVCEGGADIIQLRSKKLSDAALYRVGKKMKQIAEQNKTLFFVNDRPDLALALEADGVHLGQDDLPVETVRQMCKKFQHSLWIGKSTHSFEQGKAAIAEKPDYLGVGPVFETPTKPNYQPAGLAYVSQAAKEFRIPFVAIGGIDLKNISQVLEAGARRVAVVRALFLAAHPKEAASQFKKHLEESQYVAK